MVKVEMETWMPSFSTRILKWKELQLESIIPGWFGSICSYTLKNSLQLSIILKIHMLLKLHDWYCCFWDVPICPKVRLLRLN